MIASVSTLPSVIGYQDILKRFTPSASSENVGIELTYRSHLRYCFFCYNDRKTRNTAVFGGYRALLEDIALIQTLSVMLTGGEPIVHPHYFDIGPMTRASAVSRAVRPNGQMLARAQTKRLRRSEPHGGSAFEYPADSPDMLVDALMEAGYGVHLANTRRWWSPAG